MCRQDQTRWICDSEEAPLLPNHEAIKYTQYHPGAVRAGRGAPGQNSFSFRSGIEMRAILRGDVVAMMQTAEAWHGHNHGLWTVHRHRSWVRRVLL